MAANNPAADKSNVGYAVPSENLDGLADEEAVLIRKDPTEGYTYRNCVLVTAKAARWLDCLPLEGRQRVIPLVSLGHGSEIVIPDVTKHAQRIGNVPTTGALDL